MADLSMFADNLKHTPWWWEWAPRQPPAEPVPLPKDAEIAIVGSGFTALNAALTLARAGRDVVVLEAGAPGQGASSRNGGQVGSGNQRHSVGELTERYGQDQAKALLAEGIAALNHVCDLIEREGISCHFRRAGRFRAAMRPDHYDAMVRDCEAAARLVDAEFSAVPRADQHAEVGSDLYHGGVVLPQDASVHPALYHAGLLKCVEDAGVRIVPFTPVLGLERERQRVAVRTTRGEISAGEAILATNGYLGPESGALNDAVVPIVSAMIATEPLDPDLMRRLLPHPRVFGETGRVYHYYQPCPEHRRILIGGRSTRRPEQPKAADFVHLTRGLIRIFPELEGVKISHAWSGYIAYTRDTLPHKGARDGIHYALGYCGSGVARASYLGHKLGLSLLGDDAGTTAWDAQALQPYFLPKATRALLPAAIEWYRLRDRLER